LGKKGSSRIACSFAIISSWVITIECVMVRSPSFVASSEITGVKGFGEQWNGYRKNPITVLIG
jgi:hypothetical protein